MSSTRPGRPRGKRDHGVGAKARPAEERVSLEIASIAAGGDGVGRAEGGLVVFIPRTAPGDAATVRLKRQGRFARGELLNIDRPSPVRARPECEHYTRDRCGGCQLQHVAYDAQLEVKAAIVRDAVVRIGGRETAAPVVTPSPRQWRYRRKLTLAMRQVGGGWIAGLHPYDRAEYVFPLRDCPITDERVVAAWREVLAASELFPNATALRGAVQMRGDRISFALEGGTVWNTAAEFLDAVASLDVIWWTPEFGARERVAIRGDDPGASASFLQVNIDVAEAMWSHAAQRAAAYSPTVVVDAYGGVGEIAARIAAEVGRNGAPIPNLTVIESDADAAHEAERRLPVGTRVITGLTEDMIGGVLPADVVVVNPPRGGLHERVTVALQETVPRPDAIVYVSCDPATLARDLRRLPAYRIQSVRAFDMFPQTAHVETVCELVPGDAVKYTVDVDGRLVEVKVGPDGLTVGGRVVRAELTRLEGGPACLLAVGRKVQEVLVRRGASTGQYSLWLDGRRHDVEALDERALAIREMESKVRGPVRAALLAAPMPGLIVRVLVEVGASVIAEQGLIVMEAMKMENELRAPGAGVIKRIAVAVGMPVERGAVLVEFE